MRAQCVDLLRQQKVVNFVYCCVLVPRLHQSLLQRIALACIWLQLLVCFDELLLTLRLRCRQLLSRLDGLVNVRAEVVRRYQLEHIGVEGWHSRLNVVKKVCLLHVRSVNLNWYFFEEFFDLQVLLINAFLHEVSDGRSLVQRESGNCFFRESISFERRKTVVRFLSVVDDHD